MLDQHSEQTQARQPVLATGVTAIPNQPDFSSGAEATVWGALMEQLRQDPRADGSLVLANLRLVRRRRAGERSQVDMEADLVLAIPGLGIVVIEVKGGHIGRNERGWYQLVRGRPRQIDPAGQARVCKYALRDFLDQHPSWEGRCYTRMAHMIAFPDAEIPADYSAPDVRRSMIIDRTSLPHMVDLIFQNFAQLSDERREPMSAAQIQQLATAVRAPLGVDFSAQIDVESREQDLALFAQQQEQLLDVTREISRAHIRGGAGTGKTLLALAKVTRCARAGLDAAFVCYSRGLAAFAQRYCDTLPEAERPRFVGTFQQLGEWWGIEFPEDGDAQFWEVTMPRLMAQRALDISDDRRCDAVVVDEAQDLGDSWWDAIYMLLRDPAEGVIYVFSDEGQRIFGRHGQVPEGFVPLVLSENVRNTHQIAQTFQSLTEAQGAIRNDFGLPVRFIHTETENALAVADAEVLQLLGDGWEPRHIALLTTSSRHPEQVARQEQLGHEGYWQTLWDESVFYANVFGFKGLERPVVVVAVNGFRVDDRAREALYTALSRARDALIVCGDTQLLEHVGGAELVGYLTGGAQLPSGRDALAGPTAPAATAPAATAPAAPA